MIDNPKIEYYECLELSKSKVSSRIHGLRTVLGKLKSQACFDNNYNNISPIMNPGIETQIKSNQEALKWAIKAYKERWSDYAPTKNELKIIIFNRKLKHASNIYFEYGSFSGSSFKILNAEIKDNVALIQISKNVNPEYIMVSASSFLDDIKNLNMGEWKPKYYRNEPVIDGYRWAASICYNNMSKWSCEGQNVYPYNFKDIDILFDKYKLKIKEIENGARS